MEGKTLEELRDYAARLRAELLFAVKRGDAALVATGSNIKIMADVDEVLNAFLAQGRAEGAEQEREKIRKAGELIKVDESMSGIEGDWASLDEHRGEIEGMSARVDLFIVPASVLAPSDEVLQKQMEEQLTEDQEKEDMLAEERKRNERQADVERWHEENS